MSDVKQKWILDCDRCALTDNSRNGGLWGIGPIGASVMVVDDYPSNDEDKRKELCSDSESLKFQSLMVKRGIPFDDIYWTAAVRCPVGESSDIKQSIVTICKSHLDEEIEEVNPRIIVPTGPVSLKAVLGKTGMTKSRGRAVEKDGRIILPIYHPKVALRFPGYKEDIGSDVDNLVKLYKTGKIEVTTTNYKLLDTVQSVKSELDKLRKAKKLTAFDIETTGLEYYRPWSKIVMISFSNQANTGIAIPLFHRQTPFSEKELEKVVDLVADFMEDPEVPKVAHNGKFDMTWLKYVLDIDTANYVLDTQILHYLTVTEELGTHDLKSLAWEFTDMGGYDNELDEYRSKLPEDQRYNYDNIPLDILWVYGAADPDCTLRVAKALFPDLKKNQKWQWLMDNVYIRGSYSFRDIQMWGMKTSSKVFKEYDEAYGEEVARIQNKLRTYPEVLDIERERLDKYSQRQALLKSVPKKDRTEEQQQFIDTTAKYKDYEFNFASVQQVSELLFGRLKLSTTEKTKTGAYSTNEDALKEMSKQHPLPNLMLEFRKINTLNNMFVKKLPLLVQDDFVHPSFNLTGTVTSRISTENPNSQQIPRMVEDPLLFQYRHEIKKIFISRFGTNGVIMQADYSQLELRLACLYSLDKNMLKLFNMGGDIHKNTAAWMWTDNDVSLVDKDMRTKAKAVNFGIIYKKSGYTFAVEECGYDLRKDRTHPNNQRALAEGYKIVDDYLGVFKELKQWMDDIVVFARKHGYVETIFGNRRRLPNLRSNIDAIRAEAERQAVNAPIQGTGAVMTLLSCNKIHEYIKKRIKKSGFKSVLINTVHDSIVFDVYLPELLELTAFVRDTMENILDGHIETEVPIVADFDIGEDYGTMFGFDYTKDTIETAKDFRVWLKEKKEKKYQGELEFLRVKHKFTDAQVDKYIAKWYN